MSDLEKISIYVPKHISAQLDSDASMFEILKNDRQTINRNHFLSMLILGYHNSYVTECQNSYDLIEAELLSHGLEKDKSHEIADAIIKKVVLPYVPSRKSKNSLKLSLKPTKDTEGIINTIMSKLVENDSVSRYFCRMIMQYCEKPFSEREKIIFREKYSLLKNACEHNRPISFATIWEPKAIHEVIPYKLVVGKEEFYNYLLCAEFNKNTGNQEAKVFRLNRISSVNYERSINKVDERVIEFMNRMIKLGPQYIINDDDESCVLLTESGIKNYNRIYYGRPQVDRIEKKPEGHYYYFRCSKDQVFLYFRRFGYADAEIISPEPLRERMLEFHKKAYEVYK